MKGNGFTTRFRQKVLLYLKVDQAKTRVERNLEIKQLKNAMDSSEGYLNHYLKILINNLDDFFIYKTSKDVCDDLDALLNNISDEGIGEHDYFCFDTADGGNVALSVSGIQMVNFLFDIGHTEKDDPEAEEAMDEMGKIYLRGKKDPFITGFGEPIEALSLFATLGLGEFDDEPFFSFVDVDGEQVTLRLQEIVLLELPESLVSYGEELLEEQLKELKQKGERERKRASVVLDFVKKKKEQEAGNAS